MKKVYLAIAITLMGVPSQAVPPLLNYQGRLAESGALVNGSRDATFRIFPVSSGGTALFTETHSGASAISVSSGIFNVLIGALSGGVPIAVFDGADRYLEVTIGAATLPRQRLVSVGYAFRSEVSSSIESTGTISIELLNVSSINVNGSILLSGGVKIGNSIVLGAVSGTLGAPNTIAFDNGDGFITTADPSPGKLILGTAGINDILLLPGGKVGVGTSAPAAKLDVAGSLEYRGKSWLRFTRGQLSAADSDANKDALCSADVGSDYLAASMGETSLLSGLAGASNVLTFTFAGSTDLWSYGHPSTGIDPPALAFRGGGSGPIVCVHKLAPLRFTRTFTSPPDSDAAKDAACGSEFGGGYMAAGIGDLAVATSGPFSPSDGSLFFAIAGDGQVWTSLGGSSVSEIALRSEQPASAVLACIHK